MNRGGRMWEIVKDIFTPVSLELYLVSITKLVLAFILGGFVGYQRGSKRSPAGLKTHVLVCLGSTLVMIISDYLRVTTNVVTADPARLGAQVISGIGFLGAGTILKEGSDIKGLTTAAGIWAVACLGLCIGAGAYGISIIATILIVFGLATMRFYEETVIKSKTRVTSIFISSTALTECLVETENYLKKKGVKIKRKKFITKVDEETGVVKLDLKVPYHIMKRDLRNEILKFEGVNKVY